MNRKTRWAAAALLVGTMLTLAACGGSDDAASTGVSGNATGADFDRAFIDAMVPHHQAAIEMAAAAKENGLSQPDLVKVAADILETQQLEIGQMKDWRGEWFGSSQIDPKGAEALGLRAGHAEIKDLATSIIEAQEREVEVMRPHSSGTMNHG